MALLQIRTYPDPALKQPAREVENITGDIVRLAEDMAETMYAAPGVGLAAVQVAVPRRVVVLDLHDEATPPGKRLLKLINPVIAEREGEIVWEEGCLSVPDFTAPVRRARRGREGLRQRLRLGRDLRLGGNRGLRLCLGALGGGGAGDGRGACPALGRPPAG